MQLNQESSVVFFYCSFDNAASQDPVNILASLVAQLAEKAPQILDVYKARYLSPDRPTVLELEDQIIDHSRTRDRLYIFIDAVNESSSSVSIIKSLSRIVQASKNVGILMTSTPEVGAQEMMQNWVKPVDMQKQRIENDITLFVNVRIQQSPTLRSISETIKLKIQRTVVQKADGMYDHARFVANSNSCTHTWQVSMGPMSNGLSCSSAHGKSSAESPRAVT